MEPNRDPSRRGPRVYTVLFGRCSVAVCGSILLGAIVMPPDGFGVEVCYFKAINGQPCPGCGLSRSVRNLAHGWPLVALNFHPFGFFVLPYAILATSSLVWTKRFKRRVRRGLQRHEAGIRKSLAVCLGLFLAFGMVRLLLSMAAVWRPF